MVRAVVISLCAQTASQPVDIVRIYEDGAKLSYLVTRRQKDADKIVGGSGGIWRVDLEVLSSTRDVTRLALTRTAVKLDAEDSPAFSEEALRQLKRPARLELSLAKDGKLEVAGDSGAVFGFEGPLQWFRDVILPSLPHRPVKPGDTWEEPFQATPYPTFVPVETPKMIYRFDGQDRIGEMDTLKITATASLQHVTNAGLAAEGKRFELRLKRDLAYTLWLAPKNGRLLKNTGTEVFTLESPSADFPLRHTFTMTVEVVPVPTDKPPP